MAIWLLTVSTMPPAALPTSLPNLSAISQCGFTSPTRSTRPLGSVRLHN